MPKDVAYHLAEKKIAAALQSGATELDLGGEYNTPDEEKISELPVSLWECKHLKSLKINYTKLTTLPDSLGQLTQLTELTLSRNRLTTLPDSLGPLATLTQLQSLNLSGNQLAALPDSLGQLTQLTELYLSDNQLTTLPETIKNLKQLKRLSIGNNKFDEVPNLIGELQNLISLHLFSLRLQAVPNWLQDLVYLEDLRLDNNKLTNLPESLGNLVRMRDLHLGSADTGGNPIKYIPECIRQWKKLKFIAVTSCDLLEIPDWLDELPKLESLFFRNNRLINIPSSIAQIENLKSLYLENNPLNPALQSAYDACDNLSGKGKYEPLFAYLRSLEQNAEPLYEAKLVLVGEGNVGKTTLLKALKGKAGEAPQEHEPTTHGVEIDIHGLRLPHPAQDGVEIQLNAWDFGGQDVYRVTHQFFFSRRSLYLLVWEPRRGVQQGQVEDWLNMIRLRVGDEARVLIVSTHCKTGERIARIDQPVLQQQYGAMIVGFYEVDSLVPDQSTGEMVGIAELKKVIARESAKLEQMGMRFNRDWKAARDELIALPEPRISFGTFSGICAARGLSDIATETLAHLMHDLGYIVYYSDDEKLRDDVVLKPEWLTKAIGFVLEDRATAEREGILPDNHLYEVWHDHKFKDEPRYEPNIYPFFLRLMEKYDVCYRLTDGKASLVAQHVPQVRPELPWLPEQEPLQNQRRIAMVCSMEEDPPGLVPWMIVRTHDYAYPVNAHSLHWQKGMFLSHGAHGTAMLEKRGREFHVYTQAQWPEYFMNVLQHTLQKLITDNWPGLEGRYDFKVPCPETVNGQPCKGRFKIQTLRQWLAEGDTTARCQECSCRVSIAELLFGFEERDISVQLREIKEQLAGMDSRIANYFMATMNAIADEGKNGPRLFTLSSGYAESSLEKLLGHPMELQLWCEAEGCQHPLYDYGLYKIDSPKEWVKQMAHYAIFAFKLLNIISPIAAPAINTLFGPKTTETWGIDDRLKLAGAIIGKLPTKIETHEQRPPQRDMLNEVERSGILALHRLLNELDPTQAKLGLHRVATYTGDYRWLCKYHYDRWQPNIPDVIGH